METLQNVLSQQIVQKLGWTLVHFIWQGAVIAILTAAVLKLFKKASSNLRYITVCFALAVIVILPVITFQIIEADKPLATPLIVGSQSDAVNIMQQTAAVPMTKNVRQRNLSVMPLKERFVSAIEPILPYAVLGWLFGVFVLSVWYLGGWTQLQRLRKQMVKQVSDDIRAKLNQLSQILGIRRAVNIAESALVNVPTVIGHFKPIVLLPASALTGLSCEQIEAILAHELAHIKRCDYLVNILQTVVEILGFYHPAVWWISNKIRIERENCCDDLAVGISGNKICYAEALTKMEEIRFSRPELAVAASGGSLFDRIRRLLGKDSANNEKAGWLPSVIVLLFIGILIPMALTLSSCDKDKLALSTINAKISEIDINSATIADVIKVFGEPEKYSWNRQIFDKDNLPNQYVAFYPDNFYVFITNDHIIEFRFEGPSDYVFGDGLVVGSPIEKVFSVLGRPSETVEGKPNKFEDNVFYKNMNGKKGYGYYAVPEKNVRIWIMKNKVGAIYLTRSNFSGGPGKKLKDEEIPQTSIIDANDRIVDKVDYPFIDDPEVIGNWKSVDFVNEIANFNPNKKQWIWGDMPVTEMLFEKEGTAISKMDKDPNSYVETWTKGLVLHNDYIKTTASKYTIKRIDDSTYMFLEWKTGDYVIRHMKPKYCVFKKQ